MNEFCYQIKEGDTILYKLKTSNNFTYGKSYTIISIAKINDFNCVIRVQNDKLDNYEVSLHMLEHMFLTIQQWRQQQLENLLNE